MLAILKQKNSTEDVVFKSTYLVRGDKETWTTYINYFKT